MEELAEMISQGWAAVRQLLQRLFPLGCVLVPAVSVPKAQRFAVIPGDDGPRRIAPLDWNLLEKVLRQWSPIALVSRAKWRLVMIAPRLQCIGHIPGAAAVGVVNLDIPPGRKSALLMRAISYQ
ncbi:MAG: hypothetical protein WC670_00355 [Pseudolabrys sp.]